MRTLIAALVLFSTLRLQLSPCFAQGPLTPPGPPAPIFKTLQQVEPRTDLKVLYDQNHDGIGDDASYEIVISQAGSYYLSSNMGTTGSPTPVTRSNAIHVTAAGVTIDLNGFQIQRTSGSSGAGILIDAAADRCTLKNGSIAGFLFGVNCVIGTRLARGGSCVEIAVSGCGGFGLSLGEGWEIAGCKAHDNAGIGISGGPGSTLSNCTANANLGTYGIFADSGSTLNNCTASANLNGYGIYARDGSTLNNCAAYNNQGDYGIYATTGATLNNCTASSNAVSYGIYAEAGSTLTNCSARANTDSIGASGGILAEGKCTLTACTATENTNTSGTATTSTGLGISVGDGSTINKCTAQGNKGDGIQVGSNCVVADSNCDGNGIGAGIGFGINATGSDNRIQRNSATHNDKGISVAGTGNLIDGNHVRDSSGPGIEVTTAAPAERGWEAPIHL